MQKVLSLFLLFQVFFLSGFSQDIVKAIDKEIFFLKLSQLHVQPDTGYRHNPKGERIGITLDTAFFDNNKKLVLFTRSYKYKRIDSIETETRHSYYFLSNNANKVVNQYSDPTGSKIYVSIIKTIN
jgi:hypothetical protein